METTRKYTIGDAELVAEILEGEVLQLDEVGTTHVHGHGGGGVVSNGEGYVSDVRISSHTSWETKVWVNHNGREVQWGIPGSLALTQNCCLRAFRWKKLSHLLCQKRHHADRMGTVRSKWQQYV